MSPQIHCLLFSNKFPVQYTCTVLFIHPLLFIPSSTWHFNTNVDLEKKSLDWSPSIVYAMRTTGLKIGLNVCFNPNYCTTALFSQRSREGSPANEAQDKLCSLYTFFVFTLHAGRWSFGWRDVSSCFSSSPKAVIAAIQDMHFSASTEKSPTPHSHWVSSLPSSLIRLMHSLKFFFRVPWKFISKTPRNTKGLILACLYVGWSDMPFKMSEWLLSLPTWWRGCHSTLKKFIWS